MTDRIIYKYLPLERLTYLDDALLRLTQPGDLNDPFECLPVPPTIDDMCHILEEQLKSVLNTINTTKASKAVRLEFRESETRKIKSEITKIKKNLPGNLLEAFLSRAERNINSNVGIISFSRRWNSTLMWSHYTNSHKGFCIGFNASDSFFLDYNRLADTRIVFLPVVYTDQRLKVPTEEGVKIDPMVMLTKSKDWAYEEEERLLAQFYLHHKKISSEPFDIYLFKLEHHLIREIIAGAKMPSKEFSKLASFCRQFKIPLFKSKISEKLFDMERAPVNLDEIA